MNECIIFSDVQANEPLNQVYLNKVGVTNVKRVLNLNNNKYILINPIFSLFVDLPSSRKGANLSRNFEALDKILYNYNLNETEKKIENLCDDISYELLKFHEYSIMSEVSMKCQYIFKRLSPKSKIENQKFVDLYFRSTARRENNRIKIKKKVTIELIGITACPCAQSMMKDSARSYLYSIGLSKDITENILNNIPMATHNQRGKGMISIEIDDVLFNDNIDINSIIEIIESSMSSNIYEILKRLDEKSIVEEAHKNPKFVEDCVRSMAKKVVDKFPHLPDNSLIVISQINEESIHEHNAYAEIKNTIKNLRNIINENN